MNEPLVSICVPSYNCGPYVEATLESAVRQTYSNVEVVLVDNRSTDDSLERVARFRSVVQAYLNAEHVPMVRNFNRTFAHARGEFLVFLSADDCLAPTFVARCVGVLGPRPDIGLVVTERDEIDEAGTLLQPPPFFYNQSCVVPSESQLPVMMMTGIGVPCQAMFRRTVFEMAGGFDERFGHAFDWHANFACVMRAHFAYLHERLAQYRVFDGNSTAVMTRNMGMSLEHYLLLLEFKDLAERHGFPATARRYPEALEKLAAMCVRYSVRMIKEGVPEMARRYLHLARAYSSAVHSSRALAAVAEHLEGRLDQSTMLGLLEHAGFNAKRKVSYEPPEGYEPMTWIDRRGV